MHKILIVDDEVDIASNIKFLIENQFSMCDIKTASNGLDAFIECQKEAFDLIITDHKMPIMTGSALIIALRTKETKNRETPAVMLSAFVDNKLKSKLRIQNTRLVEKPFTPDDFLDVILTYLV